MLRVHHRIFAGGIKSLDIVIVAGAVCLGSGMKAHGGGTFDILILQQAAIVCLAWVVVSIRKNFYQSRRTSELGPEFYELTECWLISLGLGTLLIAAIGPGDDLAYDPIITFCSALAMIGLLRLVVRQALRRIRGQGKNFRNVILVGRGRMANQIAENVVERPEYGLRIVGGFHLDNETGPAPEGIECLGNSAGFAEAIADLEIDSVVLCPDMRASQSDIQSILDRCDVAGIHCLYAPDFLRLNNLRATSTTFSGMPAFTFQPSLGSPAKLAIKRSMDIVGSLIGIILALPLLAAIAIAIKFSDGGPLLFRQVRLGKHGRRFNFYKFRSMCIDAEAQKEGLSGLNEQDGPVFKIRSDPRITRVGRLLRKYSLDELPQLFNVLFGDMSLVGPRPPVPSEVARYSWWQRRRISVRPGLTCLWQVKGRNQVSFEKWMEMDLFYIDNWSLWMDIKLMAQTMPAVVRGTGT